MSYTAPAGNAVGFTLTGTAYSAPLYNAVYFVWLAAVPTFTFVSKSTMAFRAGSSFGLSSTSTTQFENPYRAFSIPSTSSVAAVTDLRSPQIFSTSTPLFSAGFIASISTSSALDFAIRIPAPTSYALTPKTTLNPKLIGIANSTVDVRNKSVLSGKGGYNAMMAMRIRSDSKFAAQSIKTANLSYNLLSSSSVKFKLVANIAATTSINTASAVSGFSVARANASTSIASGTSGAWCAIPATQSVATVASSSSCAYLSSFQFNQLDELPEHLVFARSVMPSIYARS